MKKIILCSLVAMMAVTAANAEIASVEYVGNTADLNTTEKDNFTDAINELVDGIADINTELGSMATSETVTSLTERVTTAEGEIDALQAVDQGFSNDIAAINNAETGILAEAKKYADANDADTIYNDTEVRNLISANAQAIAGEVTAREQADTAISNKIGTVTEGKTVVEMIADAQDAATYDDSAVRGLISAETTARENADTTLDGKITALDTAYKAADTAISNKIGNVAEGKTVVEMITEAQTAATYDDTQVKEDIATNAGNIATNTQNIATNTQNIAAINNAETGILAQAQAYADANDADTIYNDTEVRNLISDAQATADAAVEKEQVGIGENFAISDECKAAGAVCSLVVRAGVAGWEKIRY